MCLVYLSDDQLKEKADADNLARRRFERTCLKYAQDPRSIPFAFWLKLTAVRCWDWLVLREKEAS